MEKQATPGVDKFFGDTGIDMSVLASNETDLDQGTDTPDTGEASAAQQEGETTAKSEESSAKPDKTENKEEPDFQALFQDAEDKRARQQSRADTEAFKNTKLTNRISELEAQAHQQQQTASVEDEDFGLEGMDNDEYLTVKDVKKLLNKRPQTQKVVTPEQRQGRSESERAAFEDWVRKQPDVQLVNDYYNANKQEVDSYLDALGTDEMGQYQALRGLAAMDQTSKLQHEVSVLKAPKRQKAVPIAGPGSGASGGNVPSGPKGEDGYDRFFDQSWNR